MAAFAPLVWSAAMMHRKSRARAAATLALLAPLMGCQLVKKLTGRGGNDAGARTTAAPIGDAGGASPVIALPNPTVAPLPTTAPPVPPAPADAPPAGDDAAVAATDASAVGDVPVVAVVDGGAVPTDLEGGRRHHGGYIDNYCKEHPGRVHPRTHVLCPM